jgi:hypothetical protein
MFLKTYHYFFGPASMVNGVHHLLSIIIAKEQVLPEAYLPIEIG